MFRRTTVSPIERSGGQSGRRKAFLVLDAQRKEVEGFGGVVTGGGGEKDGRSAGECERTGSLSCDLTGLEDKGFGMVLMAEVYGECGGGGGCGAVVGGGDGIARGWDGFGGWWWGWCLFLGDGCCWFFRDNRCFGNCWFFGYGGTISIGCEETRGRRAVEYWLVERFVWWGL